MQDKILSYSGEPDSSAASSYQHTYSALELGEMMNQQPLDLLKLDIGYQTRWFDCDYIEEILSYVRNEADMKMLMTLIVQDWRAKTAGRHPRVAYRDAETKNNIPYVEDLEKKLDDICTRLLADREQIQQTSLFRRQFMEMYSGSTQSVGLKDAIPNIETATNPPQFIPEEDSNSNYHTEISSLPESIRNKILVSQQVFDVFVEQLNTDIWNTILTNKGKYCDPLRFLCIKHEIVSSNMEREDFDILLHEVVGVLKNEPSLMSSMGRSKLTSSQKISRSLACYDSPIPRHKNEIWQLINDCKPLEEGLQPVYDAMKNEKLVVKSEAYQV